MSHYSREKLKMKAKHNFNIGFYQHSTFIKYKLGKKEPFQCVKAKYLFYMLTTGQPVSQSGVGYVVQFCSFSHWHLIFYILKVGTCQCIMGVDLLGVLKSVLVQNLLRFGLKKRARNTHKKRHKNVFYSKTPSYKKSILK